MMIPVSRSISCRRQMHKRPRAYQPAAVGDECTSTSVALYPVTFTVNPSASEGSHSCENTSRAEYGAPCAGSARDAHVVVVKRPDGPVGGRGYLLATYHNHKKIDSERSSPNNHRNETDFDIFTSENEVL